MKIYAVSDTVKKGGGGKKSSTAASKRKAKPKDTGAYEDIPF